MTLFDLKRIFLSIKEHKKDSILIFLIVFILTIFTTIFYVFYLSSEQMSKAISDNVEIEIKVSNGYLSGLTSDSIYNLMDKYNLEYSNIESYYTSVYNIIEKLSNYDGINYYGSIVSIDASCKEMDYNSLEISNANLRMFDSDMYTITDGRFFSETELNGGYNYIMVKNTLSLTDEQGNYYSPEIGDKISIVNKDDEEFEFEIIGFYRKNADDNIMDVTNFYNASGTAFLLPLDDLIKVSSPDNYLRCSNPKISVKGVDNAQNVYNFLDKSLNSLYIGDRNALINHDIDFDDSLAKKLEKPIKAIKILFQIISIIMILIMFILLCSILITVINNRIHDIGILISLGQSKIHTIFTFLIEIFIISTFAFVLAIYPSYKVSSLVSDKMIDANLKRQRKIALISNDETEIDVFDATKEAYNAYNLDINSKDILLVYGYTNVIILVSSFITLISIARINPKELLKK